MSEQMNLFESLDAFSSSSESKLTDKFEEIVVALYGDDPDGVDDECYEFVDNMLEAYTSGNWVDEWDFTPELVTLLQDYAVIWECFEKEAAERRAKEQAAKAAKKKRSAGAANRAVEVAAQ